MPKIQKTKGQCKITIPSEIINLTGWDDGDELIFIPHLKDPDLTLSPDASIFLKKIKKKEERG